MCRQYITLNETWDIKKCESEKRDSQKWNNLIFNPIMATWSQGFLLLTNSVYQSIHKGMQVLPWKL